MRPGKPRSEAIRLLVSDVDGTLVRDDKSLPDANRDAILALAAAGVPTTLISARPPSGMLELAATLRLTGPLAAFNGGTLFDSDGTIRFAYRLEAADAAAMLRLLDRPGVALWVYGDGAWFVAGLDNPHLAHERLAAAIEPEIRTDFAGLDQRIDIPVLARLGRADHGVAGLVGVCGGVAVGRRVAAADVAAAGAHAQVQPAAAHAQAVLTARDRVGQVGDRDLVEMGALTWQRGLLGRMQAA